MSGSSNGDDLLIRLFERHFEDSVAALLRLEKHLTQIRLGFDLQAQLRELNFPLQSQLAGQMPSLIYYYVPDSRWGSDNRLPANPLDLDFVKTGDGIGLNFGCPVRLLRALDLFAQLLPLDQKEAKDNLANPTQHLATVEELLWLGGWKSASDLRRGGCLPGAKGNVDWALQARGFPVYLEAKFRPSDWPRSTDEGTFLPEQGSFLAKAAHKFPNPPGEAALHLVGITCFANLTEKIVHLIGQELATNPQVDGVIFRTFLQMTHVLSLEPEIVERVLRLLAKPASKDFPTNYCFLFHIAQRDRRIAERGKSGVPTATESQVTCRGLKPQLDESSVSTEPKDYRMEILSRAADGEPTFRVIPRRSLDQIGLN